MSKLCGDCRWWESHGNREGFCRTDPNMEFMGVIPVRQTLPSVWAKHDVVRTRPDFGCIEWESREKVQPEKQESHGHDGR